MEFHCRLGTPGGEIIEGVYVAENEARLRREFEDKGLYVLGIRRGGRLPFSSFSLPSRGRIATRDFTVFNQELATLLKAGLPLVQSLDILRRRVNNPVFKSILDDVHDRVRAGSALSEAFESHGTMFPGVYTASLMAGEKSGSLEQVIRRYVAYVKVVTGVKRKTVSALVYPTILMVLSIVVVALIVLRVVPAFGSFYEGYDQELPLATRTLVAISAFATSYFFWIAAGVILVALAVWLWLRRPGERQRFDRWILGVPGLGPIARKFATSQAARTLATLLGGGIPLVNAIEVSARAIRNQHMSHELLSVAQQVREGRAMAAAMADSRTFPDVAIKMVEVGESTGALQEMLNSLAEFFEEEIETNLGRFVTIVEPVLLILMGLVIAALLLSLYLPLFNLSDVVG